MPYNIERDLLIPAQKVLDEIDAPPPAPLSPLEKLERMRVMGYCPTLRPQGPERIRWGITLEDLNVPIVADTAAAAIEAAWAALHPEDGE